MQKTNTLKSLIIKTIMQALTIGVVGYMLYMFLGIALFDYYVIGEHNTWILYTEIALITIVLIYNLFNLSKRD